MSAAPAPQLQVPVKPSVATAAPDAQTAPGPAPWPAEPRVRRWTRDEFYKMASLGWFRGKRVLLLDGEIIEMAGQGNWHSVTLELGERQLRSIFPETNYWVRSQRPLDLPDGTSDPEPDLAVVAGQPREYSQHPSTALLVIEVADSSLRLDRRKAHAYATAGVTDYWIVSLPNHEVEVYRDPIADASVERGHRYATTMTLRPGEFVSPLAAPQARIAVADLLPAAPVGAQLEQS